MKKKQYVSPATRVVQVELESAVIMDSFVMKNAHVDQLKNIDGGKEYYFGSDYGSDADKNWFEF